MSFTKTTFEHEFLFRWNDQGEPQGCHIAYREAVMEDGVEIASKFLDPRPVTLDDADKLAEISAAINSASVAANVKLTTERDAALTGKATAEGERDAALNQVQALQAQIAALEQAPPPATLRFIKKWQLTAGMRKDDPSGALVAGFKYVIANLPVEVKELWDGSAGIEEGSPFESIAKAPPMSLTDAQIEHMYSTYPLITQADVLAMLG